MGLIKDIKDIESISSNRFNITKEDLIGDLKRFPLGVVIRMLEETEMQGNKPNVKVFQKSKCSDKSDKGFCWNDTETGYFFWENILSFEKFNIFYIKYPEYKKYDE